MQRNRKVFSVPSASEFFECDRDFDFDPFSTFDVYAGAKSSRSRVVLLETRWVVESGHCPTLPASFPRH
jgi:hypothetical protein